MEGVTAPLNFSLPVNFEQNFHCLGFNLEEEFDKIHNFTQPYNLDFILKNPIQRQKRGGHGCGSSYTGLEIFAFLLFMVYLLQFLNDLLMNAMFDIMINGENVSVFQALLLAFLGLRGFGVGIVNNNNNNK